MLLRALLRTCADPVLPPSQVQQACMLHTCVLLRCVFVCPKTAMGTDCFFKMREQRALLRAAVW